VDPIPIAARTYHPHRLTISVERWQNLGDHSSEVPSSAEATNVATRPDKTDFTAEKRRKNGISRLMFIPYVVKIVRFPINAETVHVESIASS